MNNKLTTLDRISWYYKSITHFVKYKIFLSFCQIYTPHLSSWTLAILSTPYLICGTLRDQGRYLLSTINHAPYTLPRIVLQQSKLIILKYNTIVYTSHYIIIKDYGCIIPSDWMATCTSNYLMPKCDNHIISSWKYTHFMF